jgi:hypothetical protein
MTATSERPATVRTVARADVPVAVDAAFGAVRRRDRSGVKASRTEPAPPGRPLLIASVFVIALGFPFGLGLTSAIVPVVVFFPRYIRDYRRSRLLTAVYLGAAAMAVNGLILHVYDTSGTNVDNALFVTIFAVNQLVAVGFLVWVLRFVDLRFVLAAYGVGMLLNATLVNGLPIDNVKYALGFPVALVAAALVGNSRLAPLVFVCIAVFGMANGARSFAAFAAAAPLLWFLGRTFVVRGKGAGRRAVLALLCAGVGYALYVLGTKLLLSGVLGENNRIRTERQLDASGSLIASARPEWFATWGLIKDDWVGRGPGAVPDVREILVARTGLRDGGFLGGGDYVTEYMFGGHYNLHSIIADMWVSFGVMGLLVGSAILLYLVRCTILELTSPTGRPVLAFLLVASAWYLLFGPLTSNLPLVCLTVAVCASTDITRSRRSLGGVPSTASY